MAHGGAYSALLGGQSRSPYRRRADENAAFGAPSPYGRRQSIRYAVATGSTRQPRRKLFRGMPLPSGPGLQAFLVFESDMVGSKPYPHECPSTVAQLVVQGACQSQPQPCSWQVAHGKRQARGIGSLLHSLVSRASGARLYCQTLVVNRVALHSRSLSFFD